jgi:subfamily B ATP-binding cassette protein MsbA
MYLGAMIHISWKLSIVSVISFPLVNLLTKKVIVRIQETLKKSEEASANLNDKVMNLIYGMPIVKGFAKEEEEKKLFNEASKDEISQSFNTQKVANLLRPIEDIGSTTSTLMLALGMALIIYLDHSIDASGAFVFFYLAQKIVPGLNAINNFRFGMIKSTRAVEEINELLEGSDQFIIHEGHKQFEHFERGIEIRNLSFSYGEHHNPILKNVSMVFPKGKMTAIVGPTGSGKSTITNLLLRFYETPPGSIFVDGVDIREFTIRSLRKKMSFVGQDVLLFNSTIGENITYGRNDEVSEEVLHDLGRKTAVHDFVEKLPNQYGTVIEERGSNFSGGEKQRISIARALMKDHDILIMDEATSSLDAKTEERIIEAVEGMKKDKTLIVISHRLSTIKKADCIIYIDKGEVKEQGTLDELLALDGEFAKQWLSQKI